VGWGERAAWHHGRHIAVPCHLSVASTATTQQTGLADARANTQHSLAIRKSCTGGAAPSQPKPGEAESKCTSKCTGASCRGASVLQLDCRCHCHHMCSACLCCGHGKMNHPHRFLSLSGWQTLQPAGPAAHRKCTKRSACCQVQQRAQTAPSYPPGCCTAPAGGLESTRGHLKGRWYQGQVRKAAKRQPPEGASPGSGRHGGRGSSSGGGGSGSTRHPAHSSRTA